jgi:hypothetical protein
MKTPRYTLVACLSSLLLALPGIALAGGGGKNIPQIAGNWLGQYTYEIMFGVAAPPNVTREVIMTLAEDAAGNLTGQFCLGVVSPGCFLLKGKVQDTGAVQLEFVTNPPFQMNGSITGSLTCLDGSTGLTIAGSFRARESSGSFSFNSCPRSQ